MSFDCCRDLGLSSEVLVCSEVLLFYVPIYHRLEHNSGMTAKMGQCGWIF